MGLRQFATTATVMLLACQWAACSDASDDGGGGQLEVTRPAGDGDGDGPFDPGDQDAGDVMDDEDAGVAPVFSCRRVPAIVGAGAAAEGITSTSSPTDFEVTRVNVGYECETPALVLELSGGACPNGTGHALRIALATDAIAAGSFPAAPVVIDEQRSGVDILYSRRGTAAPGGTWGNCGSDDMGLLSFAEPPSLAAGGVLEGAFQLNLPACGETRQDPMDVIGYFKTEVEQSFAEACD